MTKIKVYYFSPTGGTLQVAQRLSEKVGEALLIEVEYHSLQIQKRTIDNENRVFRRFIAAADVYSQSVDNHT